jgi:hypothetical protein
MLLYNIKYDRVGSSMLKTRKSRRRSPQKRSCNFQTYPTLKCIRVAQRTSSTSNSWPRHTRTFQRNTRTSLNWWCHQPSSSSIYHQHNSAQAQLLSPMAMFLFLQPEGPHAHPYLSKALLFQLTLDQIMDRTLAKLMVKAHRISLRLTNINLWWEIVQIRPPFSTNSPRLNSKINRTFTLCKRKSVT